MIKICLLFFFIVHFITNSFAQQILKHSQVFCKEQKIALPYTNIYTSKGLGTITDSLGKFKLSLDKKDSVIISYVGYRTLSLLFDTIKDTIWLSKNTLDLSEVEIQPTNKKYISKKLGFFDSHKTNSYHGSRGQHSLWIENSTKQIGGYIKEASFRFKKHFNLDKNIKNGDVKARIRLYSHNQDAKPDADILTKDIIVNFPISKNTLKVDLSKLSIQFPKEGIFLGIDILGYTDKNGFFVENNKLLFLRATDVTEKELSFHKQSFGWWRLPKSIKSMFPNSHNFMFGLVVEFEK